MSVPYPNAAGDSRHMSWFLLFLIGVALTVTLYFAKTHAQSAKRDVRDLTRALAAEKAAVRVLRAEIAYLKNPARLSELNEAHLGLEPILPAQERSAQDIETLFPLVEGE